MKNLPLLLLLLIFCQLGSAQDAALAEQSLSNTKTGRSLTALEEVLVTARRRVENLQATPVAVTAVSAQELAANNISNISGLAAIVPGLDKREGQKGGAFAIRGIGQITLEDVALDPGVGVYLDGLFLARNDSQLLDAVSVESMQVLRGPQGTLFGKNTVGGAIIVTTERPADQTQLKFTAKVGDFSRSDYSISMDMPLVENKLLSKITIGRIKSDGYLEDIGSGEDLGDENRKLFVGQLLWDISEDASLKLITYYNDQDENMPAFSCRFESRDGVLAAARTPGRPENYETACRESELLLKDDKVRTDPGKQSYRAKDLLFGATLDWDLGFASLKSVTSLSEKGDNVQDVELDGTNVLAMRNTTLMDRRLREQGLFDDDSTRYGWSQELQLSGDMFGESLRYTVGAFVSEESIDKLQDGLLINDEGWVGLERLGGAPDPPPGSLYVIGVALGGVRSLDNSSRAVFGQFIYEFSDSLQLTTGIRYSYERRQMKIRALKPIDATPPLAPLLPPTPGGAPLIVVTEAQFDSLEGNNMPLKFDPAVYGDGVFERVSPMLSLAWDMDQAYDFERFDNLLAYVSISEGFKSGGFSQAASGIVQFQPEVAITTELGVKLDALQRRLRFNAVIYNTDYEEIQLIVNRVNALGQTESVTANAGLATIRGFEFETTYVINERWLFSASGNIIDADFLEYMDTNLTSPLDPDIRQIDRSDEPFPYIPEYTYNLSLRYLLPSDRFGDIQFVLNRNFRKGAFAGQDELTGQPQFREQATLDDVMTYTFRASWTPFNNEDIRISLYGNNITDEEYIASGRASFAGFGSTGVIPGKGSHWGLDIEYYFR